MRKTCKFKFRNKPNRFSKRRFLQIRRLKKRHKKAKSHRLVLFWLIKKLTQTTKLSEVQD